MSNQVDVAKALVKQLTAALAQNGQEIAHGVVLEIVAKAYGARNWHAFRAEQSRTAKPATAPDVAWSPAQGPMSEEQYVKLGGNRCPICGRKDCMEGEALNVDGPCAWSAASCANCGTSWTDNYALAGWSAMTRSDGATSDKAAKQRGLMYALSLWLGAGEDLDDEKQMQLDELVVDSVCAVNMGELNSTADSQEQDNVINSAEVVASNINNDGLIAQLTWLSSCFRTTDAFIDFLAEKLELSRDTLKL